MAVPKGTQFFGEKTIGDAISAIPDIIDAVNAAKLSKNSRYLAAGEIGIAQGVFRNTVPYSRVIITDGLGFQGRPYTLPAPYTSPRKYIIHAGDGYYGMGKVQNDKETLIHELTHVWQGEHSNWSWSYVFKAAWHQAGGSAYDYDKSNYKDWDDYNPEQQAQIVEDWFQAGSSEDDPRYQYIVINIRGEVPAPKIPVHEEITVRYRIAAHETMPPVTDYYLTGILEKRFAANDVAGYLGRLRELERVFGSLPAVQAGSLLARLKARRPGDKVAGYFQYHLSTAERNKLLGILQSRMTAKA